jgi:hypothetical protein
VVELIDVTFIIFFYHALRVIHRDSRGLLQVLQDSGVASPGEISILVQGGKAAEFLGDLCWIQAWNQASFSLHAMDSSD